MLERLFEGFLWKSRLMVLFAVVMGLVSSLLLFFLGTFDIFKVILKVASINISKEIYKEAVATIVGAIDIYLIATVLIIFSLGIYELFISRIDQAMEDEKSSKILAITNLEDLKEKLAKVVLMVLVVTFFKYAIHVPYKTSLELLYLAAGTLMLALALYYSHKH